MSPSNQFFALLVLLVGAAGADNLISYRYKKRLHDFAVRYWIRLDDTPIPDILKTLSKWLVKFSDKLLVNKKKSFFIYVMASIVFVCIAYGFNEYLSGSNWKMGEEGDIWDILPFPHIVEILTVVLFDISTLALMRRLLIHLQWSPPLLSFVGILSHGIILLFLMILCLATIRHEDGILINYKVIGERGAQRERAIEDRGELQAWGATNKQVQGILKSNMQAIIQYEIAQWPKGHFPTNAQTLLPSIRSAIGFTVYSHIDNTFYYDFCQSANGLLIMLGGYRGAWTFYKTTSIGVGNGVVYEWKHYDMNLIRLTDYLLTATLIIPAFIGIITLLFVFVSRFILFALKCVTMYTLELLTDKPAKEIIPFTLLAAAADIVLIILKIGYCVLHWVYTK